MRERSRSTAKWCVAGLVLVPATVLLVHLRVKHGRPNLMCSAHPSVVRDGERLSRVWSGARCSAI